MNQTAETSPEEHVLQSNDHSRLHMSEKLVFGIGDFGANYSWTFIASFIIIYMTDVVGVAGALLSGQLFLFVDLQMVSLIYLWEALSIIQIRKWEKRNLGCFGQHLYLVF
ncbi:hypothetical protein [Mammaliicoccus vitulinus]|uniref:hypothetical protein n=1 Tax=Mammaliicoccus vitulinus TaxID=71237 RepID=UPI001D008D95|nr:hypothetical protein [Mammaliicoccus vitulinus]